MERRRFVRPLGLVLAFIALSVVVVAIASVGRGRSPVGGPRASVVSSAAASGTTEPTATLPADTPEAPEPSNPMAEEAMARPLLMPALISARRAMDFCGHDSIARTRLGDIGDQEPWECLLAARDAGRAAEVVRDALTTEGAPTRSIFRIRPTGEIEWWNDATRDPFSTHQWTMSVCGRLETFQADPSESPVHIPDDCDRHEVLIGPGREDQPSGDEMAMLEALTLFARTDDPQFLADVPFSVDGVRLGLADRLIVVLSPEELVRPKAWHLTAEAFRGFVGPFSALELLASWGPDSARPFVREASVTVGPHPHCVSPAVPAPPEVAELRRLSIQPVGELACPAWWTVDLFLEPDGDIAAVTLDRYEP